MRICSDLVLFISSIIETIEVDFHDPVGPVMSISHCFACVNFFTQSGSPSSSIVLATDAICLITTEIFQSFKNQFILKP